MTTPFKMKPFSGFKEEIKRSIKKIKSHSEHGTSLSNIPGFKGYRAHGFGNVSVKDKHGKESGWRTFLVKQRNHPIVQPYKRAYKNIKKLKLL